MKRDKSEDKQQKEAKPPESRINKGMVIFNVKTQEFGVISRVVNHSLVMPARCTIEGKLCMDEVIMDESDCSPATHAQRLILQRMFNERRLCWDSRKAILKDNDFIPAEGERVRISLLGTPVGVGIFRSIDNQGRAVFYCLLMEDGTLRYSMSEILGPVADFQIQQIGSTARNRLAKAMNQAKVVWNGHLRRFEQDRTTPRRKENYYYLDEYFQIRKVQDTYKPRDRKRKAAGNYFYTLEAVRGVQECYLAILQLHHKTSRRETCENGGESV